MSLRSLYDQLCMSVCPFVKISIHSYITYVGRCAEVYGMKYVPAMVIFTCSFNLQPYWSLSLLTEPFINIDLLGNSFVIHVGWYTCTCVRFNNTIIDQAKICSNWRFSEIGFDLICIDVFKICLYSYSKVWNLSVILLQMLKCKKMEIILLVLSHQIKWN